jgi:hypothetical protein
VSPKAAVVVALVLIGLAMTGLVVGVVAMISGPNLLAPAALGIGLVCSVSGYVVISRWVSPDERERQR